MDIGTRRPSKPLKTVSECTNREGCLRTEKTDGKHAAANARHRQTGFWRNALARASLGCRPAVEDHAERSQSRSDDHADTEGDEGKCALAGRPATSLLEDEGILSRSLALLINGDRKTHGSEKQVQDGVNDSS